MTDEQRGTEIVRRPWGVQHRFALNEPCTVNLLTVEPGQRLSLQSHELRAELWMALDDGAIVQIDDREFLPAAGEELWIPCGALHRLGSSGPRVRVLEVAFGEYRQEDIVRYSDDYDRPERGE